MRRYETISILRPSMNEEEINTVVENSTAIITGDGGRIIDLDRWGMRKLAYPIKKEMQGFYVFCDYSATPEAVAEMERKFRIDDSVLRYMTVKTADVITDEEITEATAQAANKQVVEEDTGHATTDLETPEEDDEDDDSEDN
jgi:small subunit ribosomal protein S6